MRAGPREKTSVVTGILADNFSEAPTTTTEIGSVDVQHSWTIPRKQNSSTAFQQSQHGEDHQTDMGVAMGRYSGFSITIPIHDDRENQDAQTLEPNRHTRPHRNANAAASRSFSNQKL